MALDRQSIEKRDFPIGRRGYDPDAVDAHLTEIADEVEELKLSARLMLQRLAAMEAEVSSLMDDMRTASNRLNADPQRLEAEPPSADAPEYEHFEGGEDVDGARLVALNMALAGTTRQEADRYLSENFELGDREQLLNDVYSSVDA